MPASVGVKKIKIKKEIKENFNPAELEKKSKTSFWQKPKLPLYFGVGIGLLIILMVAARLLIGIQLNNFSSQMEIAEEEQKQQEETDLIITREKDLTIPSAEEFTEAEIAYVKGGDIWILDTAQQEKIQITKNGLNKDPKWSPDGKKLAWISQAKFYDDNLEEDLYYGVNIKIMDYESGEVEELLEPYSSELYDVEVSMSFLKQYCLSLQSFDWSHDSKELAYSRNGVWIKELESGRETRVVKPYFEKDLLLQKEQDEYNGIDPLFSYTYARVLYISNSRKLLLTKAFALEGAVSEIVDIQSGDVKSFHLKLFESSVPTRFTKLLFGGKIGMFKGGVHYYDMIKDEKKTISVKESAGMFWVNNNQIVVSLGDTSPFAESYDIFIMNLDGTIEKRLTSDGREKYLTAISPDKKWGVYWVDQNSIAISLEDGRQVEDMPPSASFSWRPVASSVEKKDNPLILEDHESRRLVPGNIMRLTWEHDNLDYYSNKILLCLIGFDSSYEEIPANVPWNEDRCTYTSGHSGGSYLIDEALLETGEYIWSIPDDIEKRFEQIPSSYRLRALVFDDLPFGDTIEWADCVGNYELEVNLEYEKRN